MEIFFFFTYFFYPKNKLKLSYLLPQSGLLVEYNLSHVESLAKVESLTKG